MPIQPDRAPDDIAPPGETRLPEVVADNDHRMCTRRYVISSRDQSPALGADAEHLEEVAGDHCSVNELRGGVRVQTGDDAAPRGESIEHRIAVANPDVARVREYAADAPVHVHEPLA